MKHPFQGSIVAIVTPFKDGKVDEKALRALIDWQIAEGTDAIVPCGSTGEAATLSYEEHDRVIQITIEQVAGRVKVLAGTGSNATAEAIQITKNAEKLGADGSLQVAPYYNKPTQEGLYRHFKAIAESVALPILLYNVPGRTAVNILPETVARLAKIPNIIGIKEACGNLEQIKKVVDLCGPEFAVLSGEDAQNYDILALGGCGSISVTANIVPSRMAKMWDLFASGKKNEAKKVHEELMPLHAAVFFETNPVPVKTSLALMGKCREEFRLPLCEISQENRERLIKVLKEYHLI
ncbi:MAG: 4-hydroxy-tetrahydrodipicolinate synthase [Deltaproteobacteria bacterium]|nr:4-hydroxy-tetrahydrodipicolinate synthase [Deltaproteobacteria bacterium]